jgi:hypothetical protein
LGTKAKLSSVTQVVFIPFHWVFEGEEDRKKKKKKGKRERLWKIKCNLSALLNPYVAVIQ